MTSKEALKRIINHNDIHNRIVEEKFCWKQRALEAKRTRHSSKLRSSSSRGAGPFKQTQSDSESDRRIKSSSSCFSSNLSEKQNSNSASIWDHSGFFELEQIECVKNTASRKRVKQSRNDTSSTSSSSSQSSTDSEESKRRKRKHKHRSHKRDKSKRRSHKSHKRNKHDCSSESEDEHQRRAKKDDRKRKRKHKQTKRIRRRSHSSDGSTVQEKHVKSASNSDTEAEIEWVEAAPALDRERSVTA